MLRKFYFLKIKARNSLFAFSHLKYWKVYVPVTGTFTLDAISSYPRHTGRTFPSNTQNKHGRSIETRKTKVDFHEKDRETLL